MATALEAEPLAVEQGPLLLRQAEMAVEAEPLPQAGTVVLVALARSQVAAAVAVAVVARVQHLEQVE